MKEISINELNIKFLGPSIDEGPLPAIFYFALSAQDSLTVDPYNQPIKNIDLKKVRVFSIDLPEHEHAKSPYEAIGAWIDSLMKQESFLESFFLQIAECIRELKQLNYFTMDQLALMGLSRGAFVAIHVTSKINQPITVLGFSPLMSLPFTKEAKEKNYLKTEYDLKNLIPQLLNKNIRLYIGNRDTRVGSSESSNFILELADSAFNHGVKNPPFELFIFPSIGYMGHGTPKQIFEEGSNFLLKALGVHD